MIWARLALGFAIIQLTEIFCFPVLRGPLEPSLHIKIGKRLGKHARRRFIVRCCGAPCSEMFTRLPEDYAETPHNSSTVELTVQRGGQMSSLPMAGITLPALPPSKYTEVTGGQGGTKVTGGQRLREWVETPGPRPERAQRPSRRGTGGPRRTSRPVRGPFSHQIVTVPRWMRSTGQPSASAPPTRRPGARHTSRRGRTTRRRAQVYRASTKFVHHLTRRTLSPTNSTPPNHVAKRTLRPSSPRVKTSRRPLLLRTVLIRVHQGKLHKNWTTPRVVILTSKPPRTFKVVILPTTRGFDIVNDLDSLYQDFEPARTSRRAASTTTVKGSAHRGTAKLSTAASHTTRQTAPASTQTLTGPSLNQTSPPQTQTLPPSTQASLSLTQTSLSSIQTLLPLTQKSPPSITPVSTSPPTSALSSTASTFLAQVTPSSPLSTPEPVKTEPLKVTTISSSDTNKGSTDTLQTKGSDTKSNSTKAPSGAKNSTGAKDDDDDSEDKEDKDKDKDNKDEEVLGEAADKEELNAELKMGEVTPGSEEQDLDRVHETTFTDSTITPIATSSIATSPAQISDSNQQGSTTVNNLDRLPEQGSPGKVQGTQSTTEGEEEEEEDQISHTTRFSQSAGSSQVDSGEEQDKSPSDNKQQEDTD